MGFPHYWLHISKNEYKLCYYYLTKNQSAEIMKDAFFEIALNLFFVPATLNRFHHCRVVYSGIDSGVLVSILPPKKTDTVVEFGIVQATGNRKVLIERIRLNEARSDEIFSFRGLL